MLTHPTLKIHWRQRRPPWAEFYRVLCSVNRRAELERLVEWATHKRLSGPQRLYQSRLDYEEVRLMQMAVRSPRLLSWARVVHTINNLITRTPKFPARGSAAVYRYTSRRRTNR